MAKAKMFVEVVSCLHDIFIEPDSNNDERDEELPLILLHQLVNIDLCSFDCLLFHHRLRFVKRLTIIESHQIGKGFVDLLHACQEEPILLSLSFMLSLPSFGELVRENNLSGGEPS